MFDITQVVVIVAGFAFVATLVFFLKGLYLIRAGEVGVLVKRLGGRKMPAGQVIARHGEIGTQAATLMPGQGFRDLYSNIRNDIGPLFAAFVDITLLY